MVSLVEVRSVGVGRGGFSVTSMNRPGEGAAAFAGSLIQYTKGRGFIGAARAVGRWVPGILPLAAGGI